MELFEALVVAMTGTVAAAGWATAATTTGRASSTGPIPTPAAQCATRGVAATPTGDTVTHPPAPAALDGFSVAGHWRPISSKPCMNGFT